jgi:hypothetical protein
MIHVLVIYIIYKALWIVHSMEIYSIDLFFGKKMVVGLLIITPTTWDNLNTKGVPSIYCPHF